MHLTLLADMGMPMILVQWPLMIIALVPIILIETILIRRWMPLPNGKAYLGVSLANLLSTLLGVPLAWLAVLLVDGFLGAGLRSAALHYHWQLRGMPLEHVVFFFLNVAWGAGLGQYPYWFVPAAAAVLLIPCFYASVWLERWVCSKTWKEFDRSQVRRSVFRANLASYALLFVGACGWLGFEVYRAQAHALPATRMLQPGINMAYIRAVVIPSCDPTSRPKLASAEEKLESCFNDLVWFVYDVEHGKVAVWENLSTGRWQSYVERPQGSITAIYSGRNGFITDFQWHGNSGAAVPYCHFKFNAAGFVSRADLPDDSFEFDDIGRLKHWHGDKADYWGNPIK